MLPPHSKSASPSPIVGAGSRKGPGSVSSGEWPPSPEEDIDRLVAIHQQRSSLSSLGVSILDTGSSLSHPVSIELMLDLIVSTEGSEYSYGSHFLLKIIKLLEIVLSCVHTLIHQAFVCVCVCVYIYIYTHIHT